MRGPPKPLTAACAGGDWGSAAVTALGGAHSRHCCKVACKQCMSNPIKPLKPCACAGGDWGSAVVTALGGAHSQHCRAIHMNGCFAAPELTNPLHVAQLLNAKLPLASWFPVFISFQEMAWLRSTQAFIDKETGAQGCEISELLPVIFSFEW